VQNKENNGAACISDISSELILTAVRACARDASAVKTLISKHSEQVHFEGFTSCSGSGTVPTSDGLINVMP
jgi:hypothetical protein